MRLFAQLAALAWLSAACGAVPAPALDPPSPAPHEPPVLATSSVAAESTPPAEPPAQGTADAVAPCPVEMVLVAQRFCIDRYEASMIDRATRRPLSPFYPPSRKDMRRAIAGQKWGPAALGKEELEPPVPLLPEWQRGADIEAVAVSAAHVIPQAYLSKATARAACESAGKRLCTLSEWKVACRGDQNTRHPYGEKYRLGHCNVHGSSHPASLLYGNASLGHWDPRLNQMTVDGAPLLRPTGETLKCRSAWGIDGVYDMVGNLDEWVEDDKSTFVGGFYARDTFRGCEARVSKHPPIFFDFTTGVRCCGDRRDGKNAE
jgi:hypothetical protein